VTPNPDESQFPAGDPAVDFEQLLAAASEDLQILRELVHLYFDQAAEIMTQLRQAVQQRSARDVDYLSHKLVGASLACGMSALVPPLRELESRARKGDLAGADELMALVAGRLELVRAAVQEYLANHKTQ
jgi:HPt (histidine-containing phosphotransfer) domain-containing protein